MCRSVGGVITFLPAELSPMAKEPLKECSLRILNTTSHKHLTGKEPIPVRGKARGAQVCCEREAYEIPAQLAQGPQRHQVRQSQPQQHTNDTLRSMCKGSKTLKKGTLGVRGPLCTLTGCVS